MVFQLTFDKRWGEDYNEKRELIRKSFGPKYWDFPDEFKKRFQF